PGRGGLMVTAGNSHALVHVATIFARSDEVALVELPTYHYALDILRDHDLDIVGVATDAHGLIPEAIEETVGRIEASGRRVALVTGLRTAIPGAVFDVPDGGYFVWLRVPGDLDAESLLPAALAAGVTFVPGARFDASGGLLRSWLRVGFTRYGEDDLALG